MNRAWLDRQKSLAINASFQQPGHANETASDYVNRKVGLLDLVYDYTDSELMIEVLKTAPESWSKLLDTQRFPTYSKMLLAGMSTFLLVVVKTL